MVDKEAEEEWAIFLYFSFIVILQGTNKFKSDLTDRRLGYHDFSRISNIHKQKAKITVLFRTLKS